MIEQTIAIQQLEKKRQAMEDEIYHWKQKRYQLEEIESELVRLQIDEKELITLSSDAWSGNYGQSIAYYMEGQQLEQQRIFQKEVYQLKEAALEQESDSKKKLIQIETEQKALRKEVDQ